MPTLGPIRYAEIRYASTIDAIPDLFARVAYPEGNQCPVTVLMHGLPGGASTFTQDSLLRIAGYGLFVVAVGMRGRDGASGSQDLSNRELQDILDAVATVRGLYVEASPTEAAFVGYSAGASNVLCLAGRHPTAFQICVDHFGITDYATWWSESPANQATLNSWVGGTPAQVPASYAARSPLLNLETFKGKFYFFHDQDDTTVNVHHTTDAVNYLESKGITPYSNITNSSSPHRWLHSLPNSDQPVRFTEAIWVPAVLELAMSTHVDRSVSLVSSSGASLDPVTISSVNSSTAALGSNGVFTGTGEDVSQYASIVVNLIADQASATNGVALQFSSDNTNWDISETFTYDSTLINAGVSYVVAPKAQYFRFKYTNGTSAQATFRLQVEYHLHSVNVPTAGIWTNLGFAPPPSFPVTGLTHIYNSVSNLWVAIRSANSLTDNAGGGTIPGNCNNLFNGPAVGNGGFDLQRGNFQGSIHASAATVAGTTNTDIKTYNGTSLAVHINVTNYNGGTVLYKAQWQDANGLFVDIPGATTGTVSSGADLLLVVGRGSWPTTAAPNFYAQFPLPRLVRIVETIASATVTLSSSYSVGL